jgi:heme A synthase
MLEYRVAQVTTLAAFFAIFAGATVHPTDSGMACPDWSPLVPICNGEVFPAMEGKVLFEHGHRWAAYGVGICSVALALLLWSRRRSDRAVRRLGVAAVAAVLLQGTLGGVTVLLGLSKPVSILHLCLAIAFFGLLVALTHRLAPAGPPKEHVSAPLGRWALVATAALYVQMALGALVRHLGAALACVDLPLCGGALWPEGALRQVHMVHRLGAVAAGLLVLGVAALALWRHRGRIRVLAAAVIGVLAVQVTLGVLSIVTFLSVPIAVAHLIVGALLFGLVLSLTIALRRAAPAGEPVAGQAWAPQGAAGAA